MTLPIEQVTPVLEELEAAFFDIPFENSDFQNRSFVVAAQLTPARAYRAIGLRMFAKIRAVKEALYGKQLQDIDIEENEYRMADVGLCCFEKRRLLIESEKLRESRKWTEKLLNDALRELDCLYGEFKKYPRYTREQFEREEELHFTARLHQQIATGGGAAESLANMNNNTKELGMMLEDGNYLEGLIQEVTKMLEVKHEVR